MEYIVDTGYNDGYTAPEVHDDAVALVHKLNPQPIVRCRDCEHYDGSKISGYCSVNSADVLIRVLASGYCSYGEHGKELDDA